MKTADVKTDNASTCRACEREGKSSPSHVAGLHRLQRAVGNQAYHYNFGLTLTADVERGVTVDTTYGQAFDELLVTREIDSGQLNDIPLIQVPENLPMDQGDLFLPFLDPAGAIALAKLDYLEQLRRILATDATRLAELRRDVNEATEQYLARIREHFEQKIGPFSTELEFDASILIARGHIAGSEYDRVIAAAAPTAGLAIELRHQATNLSRQMLIERFRLRDVTEQFGTNAVIPLGEIRPQIASLAFDSRASNEHAANVRRFE